MTQQQQTTGLEQFDEQFDELPVSDGRAGMPREVPEGTYRTMCETLNVSNDRQGRPMLVWRFRVEVGPFRRFIIPKRDVVTKDALPYIRASLAAVGLVPQRLSDLPRIAPEAHGKLVEVTVRYQNGYQRCYIEREWTREHG